jgi:hypothetical protein
MVASLAIERRRLEPAHFEPLREALANPPAASEREAMVGEVVS